MEIIKNHMKYDDRVVFVRGGFCPGGIMSGGFFVQVVFVRVVFVRGGFCPYTVLTCAAIHINMYCILSIIS